jgi:hypothetical protein
MEPLPDDRGRPMTRSTGGIVTRVARAGLLVGTILAIAAYVVLHSPLRTVLARIAGRPGASTYFSGSGLSLGAIMDPAVALLVLGAAFVAAMATTAALAPPGPERPLVFGVLTIAFVVVPAAWVGMVASWTGTPLLRPPIGPTLTSIPGLIVAGLFLARGWRPTLTVPSRPGGTSLAGVVGVAGVVVVGASAFLGLTRPPTGFDALAYHAPMAVYFWRDGNLVDLLDRSPYGFAMAHPGSAELWFGLLRVGFGEGLANTGQLPFALLGSSAVFAFARRLGLSVRNAILGAAAFLLAPIVAMQSGVQLNDLAASALLMGAMALASAPLALWTASRAAVTGLALGLAVTTKVAMVPGAVAVILFLAPAAWRAVRASESRSWAATAALTLAIALAVAPWWIRNGARFGNPLYPAALPFVGRGVVVGDFGTNDHRYIPSPAAWPLYPLLESHSEASGLGLLFAAGALPGLAVTLGSRRRRPLALFGVVAVLALPAWWRLTPHDPRFLLPLLGLAFAFTSRSLTVVPRPYRHWGAAVLGAGAVFSAAVTLDTALLPRWREPADRAAYYGEVWGIDPRLTTQDEPTVLLYHMGYANLSYAGDYPLLGPSLDRALYTMDAGASTGDVVGLMRRFGVQFAYVPASGDAMSQVVATYQPEHFELVHRSRVESGPLAGTFRSLFRLRTEAVATPVVSRPDPTTP